jgi:UDP-glucuronate 4-epimerase
LTTLITGGAGFIGSRLALALCAQGQRVVILDNFNDYYDPALKWENIAALKGDSQVVIVEGDIRDGAAVEQLVRAYKIERIAHLAALAGVRNTEAALLYHATNVTGSINVLEAARKHGVRQVILGSSSSVYGSTTNIPFVESDAADRPLAPYPASKRAAEIWAHAYHHLYALDITCLRFFNVYGPHGRPDMMPMRVIDAVLHDKPITLFDAGKLSRDWTYVDDIVAGVMSALERPLGYEIINLGCGAPLAMSEFVDYLELLSGAQVERLYVPAPPTEVPITYCNNEKARNLLDFAPQVAVRDGLRRTWEWVISRRVPSR